MTDKTQPAITEEEFRPFLRLADHFSRPFLDQVEAWHVLVSSYGINQAGKQPESKEEYLQFFAHCHDGWKRAQTEIAAFLVDALAQRAQADADEKACRRKRDKEGQRTARLTRRGVELQIRVARRTLDVILWTILRCEHSTMRRLIVRGGENSLSVENIKAGMTAADDLNLEPLVMAVCSDMLSLVHVGDLVVVDARTGRVQFAELKAGDKNVRIAQLAEFAVSSQCEHFERLATADFNEIDKQHYARVKKQTERNATIISTINNEGGTDPRTGSRVHISSIDGPSEYWSEAIQRCYESLAPDKKWAIETVDNCVYVGVYTDQKMAFAGFKSWMKIIECDSPVFNLTDSFGIVSARPLGAADLSEELRMKVLRGEVLVVMCLDVRGFIELGNTIAPNSMRLASKAETAQANQRMPLLQCLTLNDRVVCSETANGTSYIGVGMRDRILFDQHRPLQLLAHPIEFPKDDDPPQASAPSAAPGQMPGSEDAVRD